MQDDPAEQADFDDIAETPVDIRKNEVNTNKEGPISFSAKRNENMDQKKKDFKNYMEKMQRGKAAGDSSFLSKTS